METVSVVGLLTLGFAAANLAFQVGASRFVRHMETPKLPGSKVVLEHPVYSRLDGMPRTRTDRRDLQLAIGNDFAAPDVSESVWPRDPRM